ncbi:MAG: alpha/beta hydrolase [Chitinophagaceae bacterium]|nr:alpha/beta hydrolase [Chitinophagaceae bacterium]
MQKMADADGVCISYNDKGDGTPVVLLHGFGEDSEIWNEQVKALQPFYRIILPDLPGSGHSPVPDKTQITIEDYADLINAILMREEIQDCIMLGHSMGGYITLAFAEKYPCKLKAFGLIHSSAFADNAEKKEIRQKGIEHIEQYGSYSFLKTSIPNLFSNKTKAVSPKLIEALIEKSHSFSKEALIQYYQAMIGRPDRTGVLKSSERPVLFILGPEDVAAPMKDMLQQVQLPNQSFVFIIEETGHMSMIEKPGELNIHLSEFIKTVSKWN